MSACFPSEFKNADTTGRSWYGQRYLTPELAATFKFPKNRSLAAMLWYDIGIEPNTISGYFYNLQYDRYGIPAGRHVTLGLNVMLFYTDYTGNNDGFFISPKISATSTKLPITLFFQGIQPFTSNTFRITIFSMQVSVWDLFFDTEKPPSVTATSPSESLAKDSQ
ncbi:MAG: hypothetical protein U5K79_17120 [Cyclobacteriaceae bacterium]|nr:hypothetical protein [Cyclobacteriaceae bacterium]